MLKKDDFPMLKNNLIYLDNSATTLKPNCVINKVTDYYENYSANAYRGDYSISNKVDRLLEESRTTVKDFINAKRIEEIVFTSGTTESLNMIVFGFMKYHLQADDEVILSKSEHASNVLPWFRLAQEIGIIIKYVELDKNLEVSLENIEKVVTNKTRVIALAHMTNVIGDIRPIKAITKYAHDRNIYVVVDGAQSVPHLKTDVCDLDIDFLAFSAHKMCGPTGVGILYGKHGLLNRMYPLKLGGGMNHKFDSTEAIEFKEIPCKLEPGTPNVASIIAFKDAIEYINNIGIDNIYLKELELKTYALNKLKNLSHVEIYNSNAKGSIIAFNVCGIFCEDIAAYLDKFGICIRAGSHCSKMTKEILPVTNTCRISLYFYNNKEDIDKLVEVLQDKDEIINGMI